MRRKQAAGRLPHDGRCRPSQLGAAPSEREQPHQTDHQTTMFRDDTWIGVLPSSPSCLPTLEPPFVGKAGRGPHGGSPIPTGENYSLLCDYSFLLCLSLGCVYCFLHCTPPAPAHQPYAPERGLIHYPASPNSNEETTRVRTNASRSSTSLTRRTPRTGTHSAR
jgi:hypothetical protein